MNNLKRLRKAHGLTQQKLAEKFRLSQQSIYKYENGLAQPDITTLKLMATFFHTSIDFLVDFSSDSNAKQIQQVTIEKVSTVSLNLHHLYLYRKLSSKTKKSMDIVLEDLLIKQEKR